MAVVLGGSYWDRAREAVDMYKEGYVHHILLMKEIPFSGYEELLSLGLKVPLRHEIGHKILLSYNIPSSAVQVMGKEATVPIKRPSSSKDMCRREVSSP